MTAYGRCCCKMSQSEDCGEHVNIITIMAIVIILLKEKYHKLRLMRDGNKNTLIGDIMIVLFYNNIMILAFFKS